MALVQSSQYQDPDTSWEDTIVPALRKRLEQESRYLENRLSVHSLTSREDSVQPSHKPVSSRKESARSPPPTHQHPSLPRNFSDSQRPTAIPRPSSSMAKEFPTGDRPYTAASAAAGRSASGFNNVNAASGSSSRPSVVRTRTRSTPYPFEKDDDGKGSNGAHGASGGRKTPSSGRTNTNGDVLMNGIPTPASSRANSPMVAPGSKPLHPPPSKIPMRKRARSSSNSAVLEGSVKASSSRAKKSIGGDDPHQQGITFPPSPETSPDIWRDQDDAHNVEVPQSAQRLGKIRDEAPIFNPNRLSHAPSFEEREFEHWYRGEGRDGGGRNGGRGEIKIAKAGTAKEMLDIAVGGHRLEFGDRWAAKWRPDETFGSRTRREAEQMDYVPNEPELTDVEGDFGSEHYHGPGATEDLHEYYYTVTGAATNSQSSHPYEPANSPSPPPSTIPRPSMSTRPSVSTSRAQSPISDEQARATSSGQPRGKAAPSTSIPGARKAGGSSQKARSKSKPRPSAARPAAAKDADRGAALADAVPPWAQSSIPQDQNWDDVVLPTVAKKMGLTDNPDDAGISMLGSPSKPSKGKNKDEEVYEPAPGTFGYDGTKRKQSNLAPSDQDLGGNRPFTPETDLRSPQSPFAYPPRQESPPPFAHYVVEHVEQEGPLPAPTPEPPRSMQPSPNRDDMRTRSKELRKTKPAILVTPPNEPTTPPPKPPQDDDDAGCCKCVIM